MSVHHLKDGRWIVRHKVGADPERPTANKKYCGRGLIGERAARDFDAVINYRFTRTTSPLFVDLVNEYLTAKKLTMTAVNWEVCKDLMRRTILPLIGQENAHNLNHAKIDWYAQERARQVKLSTIHRELSDVRAVLRWSARRRLIESNPMDGYEMPKRDDARISPPTEKEFRTILSCASPHVQRAMLISWHCGLRPGKEELFSLHWSSVDFIGETLLVTSAQKGGMPTRMVPLNKVILAYLKTWHDQDEKIGTAYIVHYHGNRVDSIKHGWHEAKRRAKVLRRLRLYDIRHAFATNLLAGGANLKAVSEILGHSSPDMTMRVYQHVSNDLRRQAVDILVGAKDAPQN